MVLNSGYVAWKGAISGSSGRPAEAASDRGDSSGGGHPGSGRPGGGNDVPGQVPRFGSDGLRGAGPRWESPDRKLKDNGLCLDGI